MSNICCTSIATAAAETNLATQQFLLQQERERALRQQQDQSVDVRLQNPAVDQAAVLLPKNESPCLKISRITLEGEEAKRFQFALRNVVEGHDPAVGRCLGMQGINQVIKRVQDAIAKRGYVTTHVVVSQQDLKNGTLRLLVIPGRVREIHFPEKSGLFSLGKWSAIPTHSGKILNMHDVEQSLENLKHVPTAEADIQVQPIEPPYAKPGESDVDVKYKQGFPLRFTLSLDDGGSTKTGRYQGGATISYDNPLRLHDLLYVSYNHDMDDQSMGQYGTNSYTLYYAVPFKYWQLSASRSQYHYFEEVAGNYQPYIYSGDNENTELTLSRILYRDAKRKTSFSLGGYFQESRNYIEDTEVEIQHRRLAGWKASVFHREFIGDSTLDLSVTYRNGARAFGALPAPEEEFDDGVSLPKILTGEVNYNFPFSFSRLKLRYHLTWRGQWTDDVLIPQDRFGIGGRFTVRGFDGENILSGERGWLVRNDLGVRLGDTGSELYGGLDYGQVDGPSTEWLVGKRLAGMVVGLRGEYHGLAYDVFAGRPLTKPEGFRTSHGVVGFSVSLSW